MQDPRLTQALTLGYQRCLSLEHQTEQMVKRTAKLEPRVLSFEFHQLQIFILMSSQIFVVLSMLALAFFGGHRHTAVVVAVVYLPMFALFFLSVVVVGLRPHYIGLVRGFALAFIGLELWSVSGVVFAVISQGYSRPLFDTLLILLQLLDVILIVLYFYTADQIAGLGGSITADVFRLHEKGLIVAPAASKINGAADANTRVAEVGLFRHLVGVINQLRGAVRTREHVE